MTNVQGNRGRAAVMMAAILMTLAAAIALPAQTFTTLFSFDGTDGSFPRSALVQATNGNLYGAAPEGGGANDACFDGCGTVFEMTPPGALTRLVSFNSVDGSGPYAGLVQATDGNFYGTTLDGGANPSCSFNNCGTVFKMTPSGALTTLYSFCSQAQCADGESPFAGLVQGANGNFYGTTAYGGRTFCLPGCGTVFEITSGGVLTTLHSFDGTGGWSPGGALVQAGNGDLYGTTNQGGGNGGGTVFAITPSGTLTTLYNFCSQTGCADGSNPAAGLVQAADGNFYGTTYGGAAGSGTVFKITPAGRLTTLYSFCSQTRCPDGAHPIAGLLQATDGNLYGTTNQGGALGGGTVFEITPTGTLTTLHSFTGTDGEGLGPTAGLIQATSGSFYGSTPYGVTGCQAGCGTIFSLSVGLGPFVETMPTSGKIGATVKILGTKLTGTTSVRFNGSAAVFKVVSSSFISATVPTGATTGPVQVVTPSGTLTSNVNFRVRPLRISILAAMKLAKIRHEPRSSESRRIS